jgi:hypothetical protein
MASLVLVISVLIPLASAGGPRYVAGSSYFDASAKGMPLTWAQGAVRYYTDQGDLSLILQNAAADAFVADSFGRWTSIPTAAVSATRAGQINEDVSGVNVTAYGSGNITMPLDIQPSATDKPIAVVYDADGAVTDALLGSGASWICPGNGVFGGIDNFSADGHLVHALVIMNGVCAQSSAQLPDMKYQLVRVFGRVLGLDWSQLNKNAQSGTPRPILDDYAGLPLMHQVDSPACVPISLCYPNADQPKMDDEAAISRLYPVTSRNLSDFPEKQLFGENSARVHGSVRFVDAYGQPAHPMQGVNVVARWIDPATNKPSHRYALSSVSGFLFRGNAGNPVTGFNDVTGQPWNRFGSDDPEVEGFFDLGGLPFPDGRDSAQYELSVEALDPALSLNVGPYGPWQVMHSGNAAPVVVTAAKGADLQQDILMLGSASQAHDWREPESWDAPAIVPRAGDWIGSLSGYGDVDYFQLTGQAKRTFSVEVTALDDSGAPSQDKARPVIGTWPLAAPSGSPPFPGSWTAFGLANYGLTRLDAIANSASTRIGIADERGDGRPDYRYHARVLYGDRAIPTRIAVGGSVVRIRGMGFRPGMNVTFGQQTPAAVLSALSDLLVVAAPAMPDGVHSITISDPSTGGSSVLTDAITYGAAPGDSIVLVSGNNPTTPIGSEAAHPVRIKVIGADGVSPVPGATVALSVSPAAILSACGGAASCTVFSDDDGEVSTRITPTSGGTHVITATLAPASYPPSKSVQATLSAYSAGLDIAILAPYRWVSEGATLDLPLVTKVLANGIPQSGKTILFQVVLGNATLNSGIAYTDSNGYASATVQIPNLSGGLQVSACVSPGSPCATLTVKKVALSQIKLRRVSGSAQIIGVGEPFQPVMVQATDSSSTANPVQGATVTFWQLVFRSDNDAFSEGGAEVGSDYPMPVILSSLQVPVTSDALGLASLAPSAGAITGALEIKIMATAGTDFSQQFELESIWTGPSVGGDNAKAPAAIQTLKRAAPIDDSRDETANRRGLQPY